MLAETTAARPIPGASFGAELPGWRIAGDVPEIAMDGFRAALHRHRILLLHSVPNDPGALVAFSGRLGPLELHSASTATHPVHPEVFCVGNYEADGIRANFARGVEQWHADSSFRAVPSAASLFYGAIVPPVGGETWFLDATAAWMALPAAMQARVEGLTAIHDIATLHAWNSRHTPGRPLAVSMPGGDQSYRGHESGGECRIDRDADGACDRGAFPLPARLAAGRSRCLG